MKQITRSEFSNIVKKHYPDSPDVLYPNDILYYKDLGVEIVDDPVPLRLECDVQVYENLGYIVLAFTGTKDAHMYRKFKDKNARMILEEIV